MMRYCYSPTCCDSTSLDTPKTVIRFVFICLHIFGLSSSAEVAVIGVLTEVTSPKDCTQIIPTAVYEIESLQWLVSSLNLNNYTKDVKLELDVSDICQPKSSVIKTIEMINKYKNGPKKLMGILSMTTSAKMLDVSFFLSSLPLGKGVIQIGTTETASQLNDRSEYGTFFRVIPDDDTQFQLIAELLVQLKWNYIAILHEKDVYGEEGAELLSQRLPALGIILAAKLGIDDINEQLFTLDVDYSKVHGIVIIAQSWTLRGISKTKMARFRFILTESVLVDDSFSKLEPFENSLVVMRPQIQFQNLQTSWENLFNVDHIKEDGIFRQMIEQFSGCLGVLDSSCDLNQVAQNASKIIDRKSLLPKLKGLYTFAFLIGRQQELCNKPSCPLSILKSKDIEAQTIDFSFLSDILNYPPINLTGRFNQKGSLDYPTNFTTFKVYSNIRVDENSQFSFQEVGQYNRKLELNNQLVQTSEMWGVCPRGGSCRTGSGEFPKFVYREGDIMLFGIVPVRIGNDSTTCPSYEKLTSASLIGAQMAEAMLYAVDQINQRNLHKDLFPGKKLGIVIMDSCNQQIPTFKNILSFWRGTAEICQKINCKEIKTKTIVYMGGMTSDVSIRVSQLMAASDTIQISYDSTSSVFRGQNSNEFANFIRLTPSDDQKVAAMIDICVKMRWLYVSLIYADDAYGLSARKQFLSKARQSEICVTQSILFKRGSSHSLILRELKKRPDAKVVIVLIDSADNQHFMKRLAENMEEREFTFLGSECRDEYIENEIGEKISSSLFLQIDLPADPGFDKFLERKKLHLLKTNEWTYAAMESKCYLPLSLNKRARVACRENMTLKDIHPQHLKTPFVIQTVYAAALGLNKSIAQMCDRVEVCPNLFKKTPEVIDIFKRVELKQPSGKMERVFDDTCDGTLSYSVYQIQQNGRKFKCVKIGNWSKISGLILDAEQIDIEPLKCPNQKRCSECPAARNVQPRSAKYIPVVVAFILLLVLLLAIIVICLRIPDPQSRLDEQCMNDLNKDMNIDASNVTRHENGSNEDGPYDSINEANMQPEDYDMEETDPKRLVSEEETYIHPKDIVPFSSAAINPAFED